MNWFGTWTLFRKECWRFLKVTIQTILTPLVTTLLYLLVFGHVLEGHMEVYEGVSYLAFLLPGLIMMAAIQNAYANSSSSLIQMKMQGTLVFMQLSPLSALEVFLAFTAAAMVRGFMVGLGVYFVAVAFIGLGMEHPLYVLVFGALGTGVLGVMGLISGILSESYDRMSAFQNFIIVPLTFLSGVFYSLHSLPPFWLELSRFNPFFYMIDGLRYGFLGHSDVSPLLSLLVTGVFFVILSVICLHYLRTGHKLKQ